MGKPCFIELGDGTQLPILHEDRMALAIDKPAGWMLVPFNWQRTRWNLQAAIESSMGSGAFWARSRNLRFLRYVHRLDAETTGVMLFAKSRGGLDTLAGLFESRRVEKSYLAVVSGTPRQAMWNCREAIGPDPARIGRVRVDARAGKPAETEFQIVATRIDAQYGPLTLIHAQPFTGRTHQIRVHLAFAGLPVLGDELYGAGHVGSCGMGLRSVRLAYVHPFTRQQVDIRAETGGFLRRHGFAPSDLPGSVFRNLATVRQGAAEPSRSPNPTLAKVPSRPAAKVTRHQSLQR